MARVMGRLIRALVYSAATLVIVLALLIGLVRLMLPLLPQYQQEVRTAAAAATGFDVQFQQLSASWPLRGPELVLYGVQVLDPVTAESIATAEQVAVGVDLVRLLMERQLVPNSLGVIGSTLDIDREPDGQINLQGRPLASYQLPPRETPMPELIDLRVRLENIDLRYSDANPLTQALQGSLDWLDFDYSEAGVQAEGLLVLSGEQSGRVSLSIGGKGRLLGDDADPLAADWRISIEGDDLQLAPLVLLALGMETPLSAAEGSISLAARLSAGKPQALLGELDLRGLEFRNQGELVEKIDLLAGRFEWESNDAGWLLGGTDLRIGRAGRLWPRSELTLTCEPNAAADEQVCDGSASFIRLDDIYALARGFASAPSRADLLPRDLRGELKDVSLALRLPDSAVPQFQLSLNFQDLGMVDGLGGITVAGLAGELVADQAGGRLELASTVTDWALPDLLPGPIQTNELTGLLVWRVTENGLRVLSDSVRLSAEDLSATSRFELSVPGDGSSAFLDLDAQLSSPDAPGILRYVPLRRFPPGVSAWLERAIVSGRIEDSSIRWRGPLRAFPYERGEGVFRVDLAIADAVLNYADQWPRIEGLTADLVFDGVSLYSPQNRGRLAGMQLENEDVRFEDLRTGKLDISIEQPTQLSAIRELLLATPVADTLGPVLESTSGSGLVNARVDLLLPVLKPSDYRLDGRFTTGDSQLAFEGLAFGFEQLDGELRLQNTKLSAEALKGRLLGEPFVASLQPIDDEDAPYSHQAVITGSTPLRRWFETLGLPQAEALSGPAQWQARLMVPRAGENSGPFQVQVTSALLGVTSSLPPPVGKTADEEAPLDVTLRLVDAGVLEVDGRLRDDLAFIFRLESAESGWRVERGAVHAGIGPALLPVLPGIEASGRLSVLRVADWLPTIDTGAEQRLESVYREAALSVDELVVLGQRFPDAELLATRQTDSWRIAIDAPWALGTLQLPDSATPARPLQLQLDRLWLLETEAGSTESYDPRTVPPLGIEVGDFRIGSLEFGSLSTMVLPDSEGASASSIEMDGGSFTIAGEAQWRVVDGQVEKQLSRLQGEMRSTDIKSTLKSLGYQPLMQGDSLRVTSELTWPGPPSADFLSQVSGQVRVRIKEGALLEVEPGGGRVLGILSVASLPRRLALDFRDVFDEGLSFDVLEGDFTLENGDAYTCNLGLQGAVADLGIVGRSSLRDQDYDQLAVVRPHVSNVLALGGAVVGGPAVGGAMLLISRIFRKPLSQIGESYYEIKGPWDEPQIAKIQRIDVDTTRFSNCEAFLPEFIPEPIFAPLPGAEAEPIPAEAGAASP